MGGVDTNLELFTTCDDPIDLINMMCTKERFKLLHADNATCTVFRAKQTEM